MDCYDREKQTHVNALCFHRWDISLCIILRHPITLKELGTLLECNGIPILKWPENSPEMNSIESIWNIMKKENGNQMPCLKEEMWKLVKLLIIGSVV